MSRTKLPADVGNDIFSDSPLRSTQPRRVVLVPETESSGSGSLPATAAAPVPSVSLQPGEPAGVTAASPEVAPREPVPSPVAKAPVKESSKRKKLEEQIKITAYFSKSQVDDLEAEVYRRRRAGDRIGATDLMREIFEFWRANRPAYKPDGHQ